MQGENLDIISLLVVAATSNIADKGVTMSKHSKKPLVKLYLKFNLFGFIFNIKVER